MYLYRKYLYTRYSYDRDAEHCCLGYGSGPSTLYMYMVSDNYYMYMYMYVDAMPVSIANSHYASAGKSNMVTSLLSQT